MFSKKQLWLICISLCFVLTVGREFWILPRNTEFYLAEKAFIARTSYAPLFIFGSNSWFESLVEDRFRSWFWEQTPQNISALNVGEGTFWENGFLLRVSQHFLVLQTAEARMLLFLDSIDPGEAFSTPVNYEADFWVVWSSAFVGDFPRPKKGVLYLTGRKPTQSWRQWSEEHRIPLIFTDADISFRMIFQQGAWKLFPL